MLLFIADLHIKVGQEGVPVDWVTNRFDMFVNQLLDMINKNNVSLLVIGGDVFDRIPTGKNGVKEVNMFLKLVSVLPVKTIIYSGNHEAITKTSTFLSDFKYAVSKLNPFVNIVDDFYSEDGFDIIPYNKLKFDVYPAELNNRLLFTHVRGAIPPHVHPEIPLEKFERWELVLAGDLHSYENCQANILYPGSPYTTSFHRNKVETGAILLDINTLEHKWLQFKLPQMLRKAVNVGEPMPEDSYDLISYEIHGNALELSSINEKDVIKKLASKPKEDALILHKDMSIIEELKEYLSYIVMLESVDVDSILLEYSNINPESKI